MKFISAILMAVALTCSAGAHAAYAQLAPPAGSSTGTGGQLMYKPAANEKWLQSTVRTNAALNVGGRTVQVPAAMRMAANAPRFVARAAFGHPALLAGAIAAPYLIEWALSKGYFIGEDVSNPGVRQWMKGEEGAQAYCKLSDGDNAAFQEWVAGWRSPGVTASGTVVVGPGTFGNAGVVVGDECAWGATISWNGGSNPFHGPYIRAPKLTNPVLTGRPATQEEFEDDLAPVPLPQQVPQELPIPLPVDLPVINPSPGANPVPQPLTIPLGDPVPVPNTDPQQWSQPVARVTPSPTAQNPWRVDVREEELVSNSPDPVPDPEPTPDSPPAEEESASDTPLPGIPELYERKYPDGIKGVWDAKIDAIKQSTLFSLVPGLTPNLGDGGCPVWKMRLDVGVADFGMVDLSLPCNVWAFIRVCIIVTALFLARRLIFGG